MQKPNKKKKNYFTSLAWHAMYLFKYDQAFALGQALSWGQPGIHTCGMAITALRLISYQSSYDGIFDK